MLFVEEGLDAIERLKLRSFTSRLKFAVVVEEGLDAIERLKPLYKISPDTVPGS